MGTVIRSEISKNNPWYISKDRFLELKHFCLQYHEWEHEYLATKIDILKQEEDSTGRIASTRVYYEERMRMVKDTCYNADMVLGKWIFKAVTDGYSYTYLKTVMDIPCGKDMYYDRYRKFFWLLDQLR